MIQPVKYNAVNWVDGMKISQKHFIDQENFVIAITPEIVTGLKTVEDVFNHYKPVISVEHENEDGTIQKEDFRFNHLGDFSPKNLTQNSPFLKNLNVEQEQYNKIVRQLRGNKVLQNLLNDESSKAAFLETLKAVVQELESVK